MPPSSIPSSPLGIDVILQLDRLESAAEEVLAEPFKVSQGEGCIEVDTLEQGIDLDGSRGGRRQGRLASSPGEQS